MVVRPGRCIDYALKGKYMPNIRLMSATCINSADTYAHTNIDLTIKADINKRMGKLMQHTISSCYTKRCFDEGRVKARVNNFLAMSLVFSPFNSIINLFNSII